MLLPRTNYGRYSKYKNDQIKTLTARLDRHIDCFAKLNEKILVYFLNMRYIGKSNQITVQIE